MLTYQRSNQLRSLSILTPILLDAKIVWNLQHNEGIVSCQSVKQSFITSSTIAAEFIICYKASNHEIWLQNFVTRLCVVNGINRPLKLFCDNKSTVLYSNNNINSTKSKHINIKFLIVKERVQSRQLSIEHVDTNSTIADPFTKWLLPKIFHEYTAHIIVVSLKNIQF